MAARKRPPASANAIVPVPAAGSQAITVAVPHTAEEAAGLQRTAEMELAQILTLKSIQSPEMYTDTDELLTHVVQDKDAAVAMRQSATGPLRQVVNTIEGWFRPWVRAREAAEKHLKGLMTTYNVDRARAEREARLLAAKAAQEGDAQGMLDALEVVGEVAGASVGGARVSFKWIVERINPDLLPDEWWIPNMAAIEAAAKQAGSSEDPPIIPGVIFKRDATIGAKH
jgi:hypothetical protein